MLARLKDYLVALYQREPARSNAVIVAAVVAGAGAVGVVLSAPLVLGVVVLVAPFVVAELTRPKVVPIKAAIEAVDETGAAAFDAGLAIGAQRAEVQATVDRIEGSGPDLPTP